MACGRRVKVGRQAGQTLWQHRSSTTVPTLTTAPTKAAPPFTLSPQNELQLHKEKVRRKAAIVARQEEELAARDAAADEAGQRARGLQRDLERATEDAGE